MKLPPTVSRGDPIRAADHNMLINAVAELSTIPRGGIIKNQRTRPGKDHPFRCWVGWTDGGAVIYVEGGTWFSDDKLPANGAFPVPDFPPEGKPWRWEHKIGVESAEGDVILRREKDSDPELVWVSGGARDTSFNGTVVANVTITVEATGENEPGMRTVVVQMLHGDWQEMKGGKPPTRYIGHPFAWTHTGENEWTLGALSAVVRTHQVMVKTVVRNSGEATLVCGGAAGVSFSVTEFEAYPEDAQWWPGYASEGDRLFYLSGVTVSITNAPRQGVLLLAKFTVNQYSVSVQWGTVPANSNGSWWPLPFKPQRYRINADVGITGVNACNSYYNRPNLSVESSFNVSCASSSYSVSVPMAVFAPISANNTEIDIVPINQGIVDVRPVLGLAFTTDHRLSEIDPFEYSDTCLELCGGVYVRQTICFGPEPYDLDMADLS